MLCFFVFVGQRQRTLIATGGEAHCNQQQEQKWDDISAHNYWLKQSDYYVDELVAKQVENRVDLLPFPAFPLLAATVYQGATRVFTAKCEG